MSLNTRDVTQGGQVAFMRLRMFLQINNILSYWLILSFIVLTGSILFYRVSTQNLMVIPPFFGALKSRGHAACAKRCFGV